MSSPMRVQRANDTDRDPPVASRSSDRFFSALGDIVLVQGSGKGLFGVYVLSHSRRDLPGARPRRLVTEQTSQRSPQLGQNQPSCSPARPVHAEYQPATEPATKYKPQE